MMKKEERMSPILWVLIAIAAAILGGALGFTYHKNTTEKKIGRAEKYAKELLDDAARKAEENKKSAILEAKEEVLRLKTELDREINSRRNEQQRAERRVAQREETMDKKLDNLEKREERMNQKAEEIDRRLAEAEQMRDQQTTELERIAGVTGTPLV